LILLGSLVPLHVDVDEQDAWRVGSSARALATVRDNPSLQTPLDFVRFEPYVVPKSVRSRAVVLNASIRACCRSSTGSNPTGFLFYVGQQMDLFIEAPPISRSPGRSLSAVSRIRALVR
jgi:HlyD family secretion protein